MIIYLFRFRLLYLLCLLVFVLFLDGGHGKGPKGNPEGHEVEMQPLNPAELKSADGDVEKPG